MKIRDFYCPFCGARPGEFCQGTYQGRSHQARGLYLRREREQAQAQAAVQIKNKHSQ